MKYTVAKIRELFAQYFFKQNHVELKPVSIVNDNDKSLLWVNSGVAVLKDYFCGVKQPESSRLFNCQPALRTTDWDNIGKTNRHLTLFNMLGHFSIGDYGKQAALTWAWEFLTSSAYLDLDVTKIYATVYEKDNEAFNILKNQLHLKNEHIILTSKELNFWDMGVGPCGPNVEFYYDLGASKDPKNLGTAILKHDYESDRYLEVWNCVFSEFNHLDNDVYAPLPRKNIDTGAGLERLAALKQNVNSIYEIDIFQPLINILVKALKSDWNNLSVEQKQRIFIINDHFQACVLALYYNVVPGNRERNYVIRRMLRRIFLHLHFLKLDFKLWLKSYLQIITTNLSYIDNNLPSVVNKVCMIVNKEYDMYNQAIITSCTFLEKIVAKHNVISVDDAFYLYETHGMPLEFIYESFPHKVNFTKEEYDVKMAAHQARSRHNASFAHAMNLQSDLVSKLTQPTKFVGYNHCQSQAKVLYLFDANFTILKESSKELKYVITDVTPFYAEGGGQIFDTGKISNSNFTADIINVQSMYNKHYFHQLSNVTGKLKINDEVSLHIDEERRLNVARLHTATHLLNSAISTVLADKKYAIKQLGSSIFPEKMRFDFGYDKPISSTQITAISNLVNDKIKAKIAAKVFTVSLDEAIALGACMLDEDKYAKNVRVVQYNDFSMELCGGTHMENLALIEQVFIAEAYNKGQGVYRFVVYAGQKNCKNYIKNYQNKLIDKLFQAAQDKTILTSYNRKIDSLKNFTITNEEDLYNFEEKVNKLLQSIHADIKKLAQSSLDDQVQSLMQSIKFKNYYTKSKFCIRVYYSSDLVMDAARNLIQRLAANDANCAHVLLVANSKKDFLIICEHKPDKLPYTSKQIWDKIAANSAVKGGGKLAFCQGVVDSVKNFDNLFFENLVSDLT